MCRLLLGNDALPHLFKLTPKSSQFWGAAVHHGLSNLCQHRIQPRCNQYPLQCPSADAFITLVYLLRLQLLFQEQLANRIIVVHQHTQLLTDIRKHIVRVRLCHFLHPLHFRLVLCFLYRCRVNDLVVLLLQVFQYIAYITRCAFDLFV